VIFRRSLALSSCRHLRFLGGQVNAIEIALNTKSVGVVYRGDLGFGFDDEEGVGIGMAVGAEFFGRASSRVGARTVEDYGALWRPMKWKRHSWLNGFNSMTLSRG